MTREKFRKPKRQRVTLELPSEEEKQVTSSLLGRLLGKEPISDQIEDRLQSLPPDSSLPPQKEKASHHSSLPSDNSLPGPESLPSPSSLPPVSRLPQHDLWASIPEVKGHTKLPHRLFDHLFRHLDIYERAVYLELFRLSWGFGKDNCLIGLPRLAARAAISRGSVQNAVGRLIEKGLVEKTGWKIGHKKEQGTEYRLPLPESLQADISLPQSGSLPPASTNKDLKEISKKNRAKLEQIIARVRQIHVGQANYTIADLAEDTKRACAREGVVFNNDLFNEIIGER